jgi:hypothetical protein
MLVLGFALIIAWSMSFGVGETLSWGRRDGGGIALTVAQGIMMISVGASEREGGTPTRIPGLHIFRVSAPDFDCEIYDWGAALPEGGWNGPIPLPVYSLRITNVSRKSYCMPAARTKWSFLGFSYDLGLIAYPDLTATIYARQFRVPRWFVPIFAGLVATWPTSKLFRRTIKGRRAGTYCTKCGYDLRASKDRCPECGTPISTAPGSESKSPST